DIIWRHQSGKVHAWLMNGTQVSGRVDLESPGLDWQIQATGDFNRDGQSDILWRHQSGKVHAWLMNGTQVSGRVDLESPGLDWQIQATGDFNRDGQSDILWRHQSGKVHAWLMNGTQVSGRVDLESPGLDWQIQATGDFNRDGQSDILWRHQSGKVHAWLMNGTQVSGRVDLESPGLDWQIQGKRGNSNSVIPDYKYNQADYLNTLYQDKTNNTVGRTDHEGTSAFDTSDNDDGKVYTLVGGEVIEARNGQQIKNWAYNGTIAIYNKELNKTFIYWHFAEGSINESLKGKTIEAGSEIGIEGNTGLSYGAHTHVEVHEGRVTVDMSNRNAPKAPANSGRLSVSEVFEAAVRKGLVKLYT
ncbi:MAG: FG-GAP-like repeat-containing protein, partial [Pseudanabaena sp.]